MGTNRLQLLDVGSVLESHRRLSSKYPNVKPQCQPDTVKLLVPAVSQRLQSLRIHMSIVTHTPTILTIGDFHMSDKRRVHLAEEEYAKEELAMWPTEFNPDMNPRIQFLTLTSVPRKSLGLVIRRLLKFLRAVAVQERLIVKAQPPTSSRRSAQMLPGLRVLRLEFVRSRTQSRPVTENIRPSVSQDTDADTFAAQVAGDFSFFSSSDKAVSPAATVADFSFFAEDTTPKQRSQSVPSIVIDDVESSVLRDVREELMAYRHKTAKAYEDEQRRLGKGVPVPLGAPHYHWTGRLELVS
jgi:hypothetical protein